MNSYPSWIQRIPEMIEALVTAYNSILLSMLLNRNLTANRNYWIR